MIGVSIANEHLHEPGVEGVSISEPDLLVEQVAPPGRWQEARQRMGRNLRLARMGLPRPTGTRRWILFGVGLLVLLSLITLGALRLRPVVYTQARVTRGDVINTVESVGTISATTYHLTFPVAGRVAEIDVKVGQTVKTGQVLAKLDPTLLTDAITTAQTQLTANEGVATTAQAALQSALASQANAVAAAQATYNAAVQRAPDDQASVNQAQAQLAQAQSQAQAQVDQSRTQAGTAQAQVDVARAQLASAQHALQMATLASPAPGVIAAIHGNAGEVAGGANGVTQPLLDLVNLQALTIQAPVTVADVGTIQAGQAVSFTATVTPGSHFSGAVVGASPVGTASPQGLQFPVTVSVDPLSAGLGKLYPGMQADLTITTRAARQALVLPTAALRYAQGSVGAHRITAVAARVALQHAQQLQATGTGDVAQGQAAFVLAYVHGKLTALPVVTGLSDGKRIVVLAGLVLGDQVVTGDHQ